MFLCQVEKRLEKLITFLTPQGIGNEQLAALLVARVKIVDQNLECQVQAILLERKVQHPVHFPCRLASRARVSHGQRSGDTVRREEEIAVLIFQPRVEIECKFAVAFHQDLLGGFLFCTRLGFDAFCKHD